MSKLLLVLLLLTGCAYTSAKGRVCGEAVDISSWQLFKQPSLSITCVDGGGVAYNDQTNSQLFSIMSLLAKIAAAMPK